jgi:hypothetical protein
VYRAVATVKNHLDLEAFTVVYRTDQGQTKMDRSLARNHLKGAFGDAVHAVMYVAGQKHSVVAKESTPS